MLSDAEAATNIAVKDLEAAKRFYAETLGLKQIGAEGDELAAFETGHSTIYVYRSAYAGTNQATALTWSVGGEIEDIVRSLKAKGVRFERYDLPGMRFDDGIHVGRGMKIAWFKDPDGNILSIAGR